MDLQTLKFFHTVASEGSFLRASKSLGYAQSNLSVRIQQLEAELNAELFTRKTSGVTLTDKGLILFRYAEKLLTLADEAKSALTGSEILRDEFRIGSMESAAVSFMPELLSKFHSANPGVKFSVSTGNSGLLTRKVLAHEIDGAFIAGPSEHPELEAIYVKDEKLTLLANSSLKVSSVHELLKMPLIVFPVGCSYRKILENWLADENILAEGVIELSSLGAIIASISTGLGISLLPESAIKAFTLSKVLTAHEVPEKFRTAEIKFIFRKTQWRDLVLNSIIEIIKGENFS